MTITTEDLLNKYKHQQTLTLDKMRQYQYAYNRLEDAIMKFKKVQEELRELDAQELASFLRFVESGELSEEYKVKRPLSGSVNWG